MMTFLFLLIYILGCVAAFIYFKIDFEEQNYKYITFKENAISYAALSLFSWAGVFIIAIVRKCDSLSKVLIPFLIIVGLHASAQCPVGGDNSNPRLQHQDSLKNRSIPANAYVRVAFNKIASLSSKDTYPIDAISLSGYVLDVKYGGSETCNCHTKDKTLFDTHIVLVADSSVTDACNGIVCEVTPYSRQKIGLTTNEIKIKYLHKNVTINGYLFNDEEHKGMSNADNCVRNNCHRATTYEIHPVFSIR